VQDVKTPVAIETDEAGELEREEIGGQLLGSRSEPAAELVARGRSPLERAQDARGRRSEVAARRRVPPAAAGGSASARGA